MYEVSKLIVGVVLVLSAMQQPSKPSQTQQNPEIKVSITTGGGLFGPPKNRYQVGQRVPVSITMTNNTDEPLEICDSDTVYQDRPKLLKDGQPVPYITGQTQILHTVETDRTCSKLDVLDPVILKPKESRVVDWFILAEGSQSMGDMTWYEPLLPGKYELSIQRRLGCCDGSMFQSNKINFEVVP
jgi:hypothetical protein